MPGGPVHILSLHHRDIWSQLLVWPIPLCCNIVRNFEQNRGTLAYIHDQDEHPGHSTMPEILTVAMSGAYRNSDELPPEVIADAFYAKGEHSTSLFGTLAQLLRTAPARRGDHHRQLAPAWIPRNGNDSRNSVCCSGVRGVFTNLSSDSSRRNYRRGT